MCDSARGIAHHKTRRMDNRLSICLDFADILDIYATLTDELAIVGNFRFDINTVVHVRRVRD